MSAPQPFEHVVLVTIDTLRADHVGAYGYPRPVSPFLDSLAATGVRFERAISSSSHTGPSHASIFTSQYPARHGLLVNGARLDRSIPTMAWLFRSAGFETAACISVQFLRGATPGFQQVRYRRMRAEGPMKADETVDEAINFLSRRDLRRRFFLWVHFMDVHDSMGRWEGPPEEYGRRLANHFESHSESVRSAWRSQGLPAEMIEDPGQIDTYDAQLAFVDAELARLRDFMARRMPDARVLWVVTSDHGEGLGNHGYLGHGKHLYQEQIRVPFILSGGEEWKRGLTVSELVRHVDLLPTVIDLTGVELDRQALEVEGRSLAPLLGGDASGWSSEYAYAQRRPPDDARLSLGWAPGLVITAQSERHKYILRLDGEDEFYDLEADPLELRNLAASDSREQQRIARWLSSKYAEMARSPLGGASPEIEEDFVDELKALGYLQ